MMYILFFTKNNFNLLSALPWQRLFLTPRVIKLWVCETGIGLGCGIENMLGIRLES